MNNPPARRKLIPLLLLAAVLLSAAALLLEPMLRPDAALREGTAVSQATASLPAQTGAAPAVVLPSEDLAALNAQGVMVLSMVDGDYTHLFAYHPLHLPFTRLTNSNWNDRSPRVSPDGTRIAYTSQQNGYWDLYILDLRDGKTTRVTDTLAYDGAPAWSPDGQWLTYESYVDGNLDVYVRSIVDLSSEPLRLTDDPASDGSPVWSPAGREIAFASTRTGDSEIWIAKLDVVDDRYTNISDNPSSADEHPVWSPDGRYLAWAANRSGARTLQVWDSQSPYEPGVEIGAGDWPVWSPDGRLLLTRLEAPNQTSLTTLRVSDSRLTLPLIDLPGALYGLDWQAAALPGLITTAPADLSGQRWMPVLTLSPPPGGRQGVVPLENVAAPYAYLQDSADEAFRALRQAVLAQVGWDFLSELENAYLPLTEPPTPGLPENWLYTGRAFTFSRVPLQAGWVALVREDFAGEVYWRVFLKARYQDGSQGAPLDRAVWNLNARFAGDPLAYEQGGALSAPPGGYWVDFTELASRYDWQRLPALPNWRTFYPAGRFDQFVLTGGRDWSQAMDELYPPEALATYTPVPTYTPTPTETPATPLPPTPTASLTPTITFTPTFRPTWTPSP